MNRPYGVGIFTLSLHRLRRSLPFCDDPKIAAVATALFLAIFDHCNATSSLHRPLGALGYCTPFRQGRFWGKFYFTPSPPFMQAKAFGSAVEQVEIRKKRCFARSIFHSANKGSRMSEFDKSLQGKAQNLQKREFT